jgi:orotate phosphoribosyltransferase
MSKIADLLIKFGAVKYGDFILSSGKRSSIYIDLRNVISHPQVYKEIVKESISIIKNLNFDAIAGIPTGGLIWASLIAYELSKPLCYVRKEEKGHGTSKIVEGDLNKESKIIIIDDVATTGSSILYAAEKLIENGFVVKDAFVIVDREEGARNSLESKGIALYSLLKLRDLLSRSF